MSVNGTRVLAWSAGEHTFSLGKIEHVLDLEDTCKASIFTIAGRLSATIDALTEGRLDGGTYLNDVRQPILLGLIGGGLSPEKARALVRRHVDEKPIAPLVGLSYAIVSAVLLGVPGDELEKKTTEMTPPGNQSFTTTGGSGDPASTG